MNIFPAIDLFQGQAVRLYKGDYAQMTVYSEHPESVALDFVACGAMAFADSAADLAEKIRSQPHWEHDGTSRAGGLFEMPDAAARIAAFIDAQIAEKFPSP